MDEEILDLFECTRGEFGEVGRFGIVGAQEAVVAFNGAFLPGAVGVAIVDGDVEEVFESLFVEELGAVVGEDGFEFVAAGAEVTPEVVEGGGDGGLRNRGQEVHIEAAGGGGVAAVGVDKGEHTATAAGGVDGIHLEVSGFAMHAGG